MSKTVKTGLIVVVGIVILFLIWAAISYFAGCDEGMSAAVMTKGCFLGTPLCVPFPSSCLPPLWVAR